MASLCSLASSARFPSKLSRQKDDGVDVETFFAACDRYQAMQDTHVQHFAAAAPLDLEQLVFERAQHFADFCNHLTATLYHLRTSTATQPLVASVQTRLRAILQREAALTTCVQAYRAQLEAQRQQLQQGQRALSGYRTLPLHGPAQLLDLSS